MFSLADGRLGARKGATGALRGHRADGRGEVLVSPVAHAFITEAERELMLPRSLTKRLVNHARLSDVTEGLCSRLDGGPTSRARATNR